MSTLKNLRSGVKDKLPKPDQIELGQLCLNFNAESPFIAIKDNQENIVKFEPHNEWVGTQEEFDALETKDPKIPYYITKS